MTWEVIVFYLLLIDAIGAVFMSHFGRNWWVHNLRHVSRWFPLTKGWTIAYFALTLYIGYLTNQITPVF